MNWFTFPPVRRVRPGYARRHLRLERLEARAVCDVHLASLVAVDMAAGKDQLIPLEGSDDASLPISYSVSTNNPAVTATVETGGRSWRLEVAAVDGNNQAFTGTLEFYLFESAAPLATGRIVTLTEQGFYNNIEFHRIIQNFMVQGGDPTATGSGGSTLGDFADEFRVQDTFTSLGLLAYANAGDDTNDSQFFIVDVDLTLAQLPQSLNYNHTIFGIMTRGFDVMERLISTETTGSPNDTPLAEAKITSATLFTDTQRKVMRVSAPEGFSGAVQVSATASNGQGGTGGTATVQRTLNVAADTVNDRPFLLGTTNLVTNEDSPLTFDLSALDRELDPLTFTVRDGNNFNATLPNATVSGFVTPGTSTVPSFATITLDLADNFNGPLSVMLGARDQTVRDLSGSLNARSNYDTQVITLTVRPVNDAPDFTASDPAAVLEDTGFHQVNNWATFSAGPANESSQTATYTVNITAGASLFSVAPSVSAAGTLTYTLAANAQGVATFTVQVRDSGGTDFGGVDISAVKSFSLTVQNAYDPPEAINDLALVAAGQSSDLAVLANDAHDAPFNFATLQVTQGPQHGTFSVNTTTGVVQYTPTGGFTGIDAFAYSVRDDQGNLSNEGLVQVVVSAHPWRNEADPHDVTGSGGGTNFDLFLLTADLRTNGARVLPVPFIATSGPISFWDVVGEGNVVNNSDLFELVSYLRQQAGGEGEAAPSGSAGSNGAALAEPALSDIANPLVAADFGSSPIAAAQREPAPLSAMASGAPPLPRLLPAASLAAEADSSELSALAANRVALEWGDRAAAFWSALGEADSLALSWETLEIPAR